MTKPGPLEDPSLIPTVFRIKPQIGQSHRTLLLEFFFRGLDLDRHRPLIEPVELDPKVDNAT